MDRERLNLRPLNAPRPVRVVEAPDGAPRSINGRRVAHTVDQWRIDNEWWREEPISRMYYELELVGGTRWTGFKDLATGQWYEQRV